MASLHYRSGPLALLPTVPVLFIVFMTCVMREQCGSPSLQIDTGPMSSLLIANDVPIQECKPALQAT